jgi:hypothetical protein
MPNDDDDQPSRRGPLIAIVVVALLLAGTWWAMTELHSSNAMQDCVMSGRTNCAPVAPGH